jgi:hypothetical protein
LRQPGQPWAETAHRVRQPPGGVSHVAWQVGHIAFSEYRLPPTKEEIDELLAIAPSYGIQIMLPGH